MIETQQVEVSTDEIGALLKHYLVELEEAVSLTCWVDGYDKMTESVTTVQHIAARILELNEIRNPRPEPPGARITGLTLEDPNA